nr:MAG TPA: Minor capsid protein from bacteriophage [Caudoviricetes sp.]
MSNLIESIRTFITKCPFMQNWRVNVDFLGDAMEYSIDPLPCDPIIQKYVDGGAKKQFQFAFTSKEEYDQDRRINIENSGFYQQFEEWLESKSFSGDLPDLEIGKSPVKIETLNSGYLYDVDGQNGRYRIECRLIYTQEV